MDEAKKSYEMSWGLNTEDIENMSTKKIESF